MCHIITLITLPLIGTQSDGAITQIASMLLLGLDEMAHQMERPFHILPMDGG